MVNEEKINGFLKFVAKSEGIGEDEFQNSKYIQILRSAIPLFNQFGYKKVSVDEIVDKAGIAKGTFYLYFKNKDELYFKIIDNLFNKGFESIRQLNNCEEDIVVRSYKNLMGTLIFIEKSSILRGIMKEGRDCLSDSVNFNYLKEKHVELLKILFYGDKDKKNTDISKEFLITYDIFSHFFTQILNAKQNFKDKTFDKMNKEISSQYDSPEDFFYDYASKFAKAIVIGMFSEKYKSDFEERFEYKSLLKDIKGTDS